MHWVLPLAEVVGCDMLNGTEGELIVMLTCGVRLCVVGNRCQTIR